MLEVEEMAIVFTNIKEVVEEAVLQKLFYCTSNCRRIRDIFLSTALFKPVAS